METEQTIDRIYDLVKENNNLLIKIDSKINNKATSTESKFEKAVEHIKSIPKISMYVYEVADLIYPKIYQTRPQAQRAIRKMVAMGVLEKDGEYITKGNTT